MDGGRGEEGTTSNPGRGGCFKKRRMEGKGGSQGVVDLGGTKRELDTVEIKDVSDYNTLNMVIGCGREERY